MPRKPGIWWFQGEPWGRTPPPIGEHWTRCGRTASDGPGARWPCSPEASTMPGRSATVSCSTGLRKTGSTGQRTVPGNHSGGEAVPVAQPHHSRAFVNAGGHSGETAFRGAEHRELGSELQRDIHAVPGNIDMPGTVAATGSFRSNGPPSCAPSPTWMTSGMPRIRRSRFTTWPLNGKTARTAMSGRLVMPAYCATAAHRAATGHRR